MKSFSYDEIISYILDIYDISSLEQLSFSIEINKKLTDREKYLLKSVIFNKKQDLLDR